VNVTTLWVLGVLALGAGWLTRRLARYGRRGTAAVVVQAEPDHALLVSAAALRRLGARITRYDPENGTLEARGATSASLLRIRAIADGDHTTRLTLESDGQDAPGLFRRFRTELSAG
jgi:hypothetical protein